MALTTDALAAREEKTHGADKLYKNPAQYMKEEEKKAKEANNQIEAHD